MHDSWQCRALLMADGRCFSVLLSVLAHTLDEAMAVLLPVAFPGFTSIGAPFLCTAGKVSKSGGIVANMVDFDGCIVRDFARYRDEQEMRDEFRRLADRLKLSDDDRMEMFKCVQRWVVADRRLDPTRSEEHTSELQSLRHLV